MHWDRWLQDWALISQEKNSMAHGVEFRAPNLDRELIELAFQMPASIKLRGPKDKWILRKVGERHLPKHVARRKKIPFYLSVGEFLISKPMRGWIDLTLNLVQIVRRGYFRPEAIAALRAKVDRNPNESVAARQLIISGHPRAVAHGFRRPVTDRHGGRSPRTNGGYELGSLSHRAPPTAIRSTVDVVRLRSSQGDDRLVCVRIL